MTLEEYRKAEREHFAKMAAWRDHPPDRDTLISTFMLAAKAWKRYQEAQETCQKLQGYEDWRDSDEVEEGSERSLAEDAADAAAVEWKWASQLLKLASQLMPPYLDPNDK